MGKIETRRKRSKLTTAAIVIISILILFFLAYYWGNGFFLEKDHLINTSEGIRVIINTPGEMDVFYEGDTINVQGSIWGGIPNKVLIWDSKYNVPVLATISASNFGVQLYANDLSVGGHQLCVQGQSVEGEWTAVETVTIEKKGIVSAPSWILDMSTSKSWVESNFPDPLGVIFRPVEEVLKQTVVLVTGGTSEEDLNGDNIPDQIQQSPTTPRYNPLNVPMSAIIVYGLIILVIVVLIVYVANPMIRHRQKREEEIRRSPEQRKWIYDVERLKNRELRQKLRSERQHRKSLESKLKKERDLRAEAQAKRPVRIYLGEEKKKRGG